MIRRVVRKIRRTFDEAVLATGLGARADRRDVARWAGRRGGDPAGPHVVVTAPGGGNIGDQALFEAFVESTSGQVVAVTSSPDSIEVPAAMTERVTVLVLPELVYGRGAARRQELERFARTVAGAASLSVIGADIMDGRYSLRASVNRSNVAAAVAALGVDTRIVGFSWNGSARVAARRALVSASSNGVVPLLRDPVSARRAAVDGVRHIRESADIVFAASTVDPSSASLVSGATKPIALVNVSGLISRTFSQDDEFELIIDHLRSTGHHVVLLPHVSRPKGDDIVACESVYSRVGDEDLTFVRRLLTPAQIRGLTSVASITITGRMHLAIMTLWAGRPAITLATQGKVEGLMALVGAPELCVVPRAGFGADVVTAIDATIDADSPVRGSIADALPRVKELAFRNVEGLRTAQAVVEEVR